MIFTSFVSLTTNLSAFWSISYLTLYDFCLLIYYETFTLKYCDICTFIFAFVSVWVHHEHTLTEISLIKLKLMQMRPMFTRLYLNRIYNGMENWQLILKDNVWERISWWCSRTSLILYYSRINLYFVFGQHATLLRLGCFILKSTVCLYTQLQDICSICIINTVFLTTACPL